MEAETREQRHVAVLGGGIAGLAAAHALLAATRSGDAPAPRVTVLEAGRRLGGQIRSEPIGSQRLDVGAESLLIRTPAAVELCRELGLEAQLIAPRQTATCVWTRGRLRPLPPGVLGGLPEGFGPVLRSGILSPAGIARATLDLLLPSSALDGDIAVAELVRRRLGGQALDRLIDPLLGTIYAAGCEALSAQATAPQLYRAASERRSLIRGLRAAATAPRGAGSQRRRANTERKAPAAPPPFVSLEGGLERIVESLAASLDGAEIRRGARAEALTRAGDGRYALVIGDSGGGGRLLVDGVVIAAPARQAASILSPLSAPIASRLQAIRYASTVIVTMRYPRSAARRPLRWAGLLVPRSESRLLGAVTFMSAKWPHLAPNGEIWLRCSVARDGVDAALQIDDRELIGRLAGELGEALGLACDPLQAHVRRWWRSLPIYEPGHLARVAEIEAELQRLPAVALAGSAYRGMGVPQCIQQGREAAQRVLSALTDTDQSRSNAALIAALSSGS